MRRHKNKQIKSASNGAMADIAFLLLIFFMVVTTFKRPLSISMTLPPKYDGPAAKIAEDKILTIIINGQNEIMIEGNRTNNDIQNRIESHLYDMVMANINPYVLLHIHPDSDYQTYLEMMASVKGSINRNKEKLALVYYDKTLEQLKRDELLDLSKKSKVIISELQAKEI